MEIASKAFIVTGAASGLGEATARMIVSRGGSVVLADVNPAGEALAAELGPAAYFVPTDVTSEADGAAPSQPQKKNSATFTASSTAPASPPASASPAATARTALIPSPAPSPSISSAPSTCFASPPPP